MKEEGKKVKEAPKHPVLGNGAEAKITEVSWGKGEKTAQVVVLYKVDGQKRSATLHLRKQDEGRFTDKHKWEWPTPFEKDEAKPTPPPPPKKEKGK